MRKMAPLSSSCSKPPHIVLFPLMVKGHTIPLLHLAQLLRLHWGVAVTIFTTTADRPFISQFLTGADVTIVELPSPHNIQGAESTHNLPTMPLFISFARALKLMQPAFEQELEKIRSHVSCIISDFFLPWTLDSASRFGIPRLSFSGTNYYYSAITHNIGVNGQVSLHESNNEPFPVTEFPWIQLTRNDLDEPFNKRDPRGPHFDFIIEAAIATENSYGSLVNSFYELEKPYADYYNREQRPRSWSIGPLCLAKLQKDKLSPGDKPRWMHWLDQKLGQGCPVLYVAFGSLAQVTPTQLREIAIGLEESKVSFLWVAKKSDMELLSDGFEDKVRGRGCVATDWVDQQEILEHPIVEGFLSHCGWNSALEGICAGVPILAWPMLADQYINAKMVVEEIKVGLRVNTVDGTTNGFVAADSLSKAVRELMESEKGRHLREKVKEVAEAARKAMREGGSSWNCLNNLISEIQR